MNVAQGEELNSKGVGKRRVPRKNDNFLTLNVGM